MILDVGAVLKFNQFSCSIINVLVLKAFYRSFKNKITFSLKKYFTIFL